jgi:hypothetical protein
MYEVTTTAVQPKWLGIQYLVSGFGEDLLIAYINIDRISSVIESVNGNTKSIIRMDNKTFFRMRETAQEIIDTIITNKSTIISE